MDRIPDHPEALLQERAWLRALARQLVQRDQDADELAHEALTAAVLQQAPRSVGPRSWLAAILRKLIAGRRREAARRREREATAAKGEQLPPALDTVLRFEVQRDVADAVLALAEPYRSTVLLRFWDGLSPGAIARRDQLPVETVRTRLKRGLAMLRERLDGSHGGDRRAWAVPLLVAVRPVHSVGAMVGAGVLLMTTLQKVVAFAAAAALCVFALVAIGWIPIAAAPAAASAEVAAVPAGAPVAGQGEHAPAPAPTAGVAAARALVPSAEPETRLVVTGRVVDDGSGLAVAGAAVTLVEDMEPRADDPRTTTDGDGSFELRDARALANAFAIVRAAHRATVRKSVPRAPAPPKDGAPQVVDLGELRVVPGTRYAGRVVDQSGRGVAGAELHLPLVAISWSGVGLEQMLRQTALLGRTDASGAFALDEAVGPTAPAEFFLFAIASDGIGWTKVEPTVGPRAVDNLTIQLRPAGDLVVTVLDPKGQPRPGITVHVLPQFSPIGIAREEVREDVGRADSLRARFVGVTGVNGELRLPQLPVGDLPAVSIGDVDRSGRHYRIWLEGEGLGRQPMQLVEVVPGAVQQVVVRLMDSRCTALTVRVCDDLGARVAGAKIRAYGDEQAQATTDAEGAALLQVTATASLSVSAAAPAHRRAHRSVSFANGSPPEQLEIVLTRTQRLTGRVVDQFGAPIADRTLFVDHEPIGETDATGAFATDDFPCGLHEVVVPLSSLDEQSHWTGEQSPKLVDANDGPVTIVMQRRPGNAFVRIAVVDAATGEALDPVEVRLGLFTEETGNFNLAKGTQSQSGVVTSTDTPVGRWRLDVRTSSGHRGSLPFEVAIDQPPVDLRLPLQRPGIVLGELRFVGIAAPAELTVRVDHETVDPKSFTQFRFPGTWRPDPASQQVAADPWGGTGALELQPARNATFRLDSADPTDDLVFTVHRDGIEGRATVRVQPGQTAQAVVEVGRKR